VIQVSGFLRDTDGFLFVSSPEGTRIGSGYLSQEGIFNKTIACLAEISGPTVLTITLDSLTDATFSITVNPPKTYIPDILNLSLELDPAGFITGIPDIRSSMGRVDTISAYYKVFIQNMYGDYEECWSSNDTNSLGVKFIKNAVPNFVDSEYCTGGVCTLTDDIIIPYKITMISRKDNSESVLSAGECVLSMSHTDELPSVYVDVSYSSISGGTEFTGMSVRPYEDYIDIELTDRTGSIKYYVGKFEFKDPTQPSRFDTDFLLPYRNITIDQSKLRLRILNGHGLRPEKYVDFEIAGNSKRIIL
jgi:hypothetical protein